MENQVIKDQTLQGCHYVIMGFRALKLLSEGFGGVKPCNHQYRGCHLKNPTDINVCVGAILVDIFSFRHNIFQIFKDFFMVISRISFKCP